MLGSCDCLLGRLGTATSTGCSQSPLAGLSRWSTETVTLCPPISILKVLQLNNLEGALIGSLKGCASGHPDEGRQIWPAVTWEEPRLVRDCAER